MSTNATAADISSLLENRLKLTPSAAEVGSGSLKASKYKYSDLESDDQIRILRLESGAGDSPLRCSIEHSHLLDNPGYTAISYMWGDDTQPYEMSVGEHGSIPLTKSLYFLLKDLRESPDVSATTFWVDQICINQHDDSEKSHQVALMRQVYANAVEVITYIGPKGPDDDKGLDLAVRIFKAFGGSWENAKDETKEKADAINAKLPPKDDPSWIHLTALLNREWADRLWMVQENVVNKNTRMACGTRLIPWDVLAVFVQCAIRLHIGHISFPADLTSEPAVTLMRRVDSIRGLARLKHQFTRVEAPSLLTALIREHILLSAERKDKVYALLGVAGDWGKLGIKVDYTLDDTEVFRDAADRIARFSKDSLDILHYAGSTLAGLPSWAPDWSPDPRRGFWGGFDSDYHASGDKTGKVDVEDGRVLVVRGFFFDEITRDYGILDSPAHSIANSSNTFVAYHGLRTLLEKLYTDLDAAQANPGTLNAQFDVIDILYTTMVDGTWRSESKSRYPWRVYFLVWLAITRLYYEHEYEKRNGIPPETEQLLLEDLAFRIIQQLSLDAAAISGIVNDFRSNLTHCTGRQFCLTKAKTLCTSRFPAKPGDKVALLLGGKRCYILRPLDDGFYQFVSDAFVQGYMNGQGFATDAYEEKLQTIKIR